jgi:hypothetical protein
MELVEGVPISEDADENIGDRGAEDVAGRR